jgi:glycosyltransferase involved in cell wall biosynthesis
MKIAFITENLDVSFGGPSQTIPKLVYGLRNFTNDVEIFIIKRKQSRLRNELLNLFNLKYRIFNIDFEYKVDYSYLLKSSLTRFLESDEDAIVHVNNLWRWSPYKALKLAQSMNRKSILSARGMLLDAAMSKSRVFKFFAWNLIFKPLVNKTDCIHVTSVPEADALRSMGLTIPIAIIAHGIQEYESISSQQKIAAKKSLNISIERNYILFLSRITEHKGLHILLDAFSNVCDYLNDFDILIAGEFSDALYKLKIENIIAERNLVDRVKYLGEISGIDKANAYKAATLFVLPSRSENFGVVIGEALSYGVPVITTHGTPWSVLSENKIGAWVRYNTEDIAEQIKYFCTLSYEEQEKMQLAIQNTIAEYSWDHSSQNMFELYKWVIRKSPTPIFVSL